VKRGKGSAATVIRTRSLTKYYGRERGVAELDFTVAQGEIFGFLGPNGAGKTTTIRLLLDLIRPTSGHLELDRPVKSLSRGNRQKVGIVQAFMHEPELLVLDEPTSGLDPLGRLLVRDVIRELRAGGTSVFLNSHLLGEVEATCDRVAFVKEGRVVRETTLLGATRDCEIEIRHGGALPPAVLEELARFGAGAARDGNGVVRLNGASEDSIPRVAELLVARGVPIYGLAARRPSLEEQFLEVMGEEGRPG
jgi:ABC-2 type transport system ATP-binding protein